MRRILAPSGSVLACEAISRRRSADGRRRRRPLARHDAEDRRTPGRGTSRAVTAYPAIGGGREIDVWMHSVSRQTGRSLLVQDQDRSEIEDSGDFQRDTRTSRQIVSAFSVMEPDNALPAPGDVVRAKYRVEGIIGSGGMGAVLAARHVVTGKPVALKWLRANLARDPEWMQRFLREARAAGRIQHPNVVDIYDVEEHRGVLFLVMERLNGRPLSTVLAEN